MKILRKFYKKRFFVKYLKKLIFSYFLDEINTKS